MLEEDFNKIKDNKVQTITTLKDNAVLYFTKSSKFPRFKLSDTSYKRCTKIDKADCIIVNYDSYVYRNNIYDLIETDDVYYITTYIIPNLELTQLLNTSKYTIRSDIKVYVNLSIRQITYLDILSNKITKPIMTDNDLNKIIDNKNPILTTDDVDQLQTMLTSSDTETVALGLKLLTNYNTSETPYSIRYLMISTYRYWKHNNARTSVAIKNLIDNLNIIQREVRFPNILNLVINDQNLNVVTNETDLKLLKHMLLDTVKKYYEKIIVVDSIYLAKFNINVTINVS